MTPEEKSTTCIEDLFDFPKRRTPEEPKYPYFRGSTHESTESTKAILWASLENIAILLRPSVVDTGIEVEKEFHELMGRWKKETAGMSSPLSMRMNRNYQKIIGLGKEVIPLILAELEKETNDWFWALEMLVDDDENPTTEDMGFNESVKAWLGWGKKKNLI